MGDPDAMAEGQKEGKMEESEASLTLPHLIAPY